MKMEITFKQLGIFAWSIILLIIIMGFIFVRTEPENIECPKVECPDCICPEYDCETEIIEKEVFIYKEINCTEEEIDEEEEIEYCNGTLFKTVNYYPELRRCRKDIYDDEPTNKGQDACCRASTYNFKCSFLGNFTERKSGRPDTNWRDLECYI